MLTEEKIILLDYLNYLIDKSSGHDYKIAVLHTEDLYLLRNLLGKDIDKETEQNE